MKEVKAGRTGLNHPSVTGPGVERFDAILIGACESQRVEASVCSHLVPELAGNWYSFTRSYRIKSYTTPRIFVDVAVCHNRL